MLSVKYHLGSDPASGDDASDDLNVVLTDFGECRWSAPHRSWSVIPTYYVDTGMQGCGRPATEHEDRALSLLTKRRRATKAADAAEKRVQSKAHAARVRQLLARGAPRSAVSARSEAPAAPVARVSQVRGGLVV